jgi:MYXO-CTERM domain-containing protein
MHQLSTRLSAALLASTLFACAADTGDGDAPAGPTLSDLMRPGGDAPARDVLAAASWLRVSSSRATGRIDALRASRDTVLVADDAAREPDDRARGFLAGYGALLGMSAAERDELDVTTRQRFTDDLGVTHVRLEQRHAGLAVLGGDLVVHMDARGVTGVNGTWIPDIRVSLAPRVAADAAADAAIAAAAKEVGASAAVATQELAIVRTGLLRGVPGTSRLAWGTAVTGAAGARMVWTDAATGAVLDSYALTPDALYRIVYAPQYDPDNKDLFIIREEGDIENPALINANNLFRFTGDTHELYYSAFGRDSYTGNGVKMRTVLLANENCPNAYWDGQTTNYCPGFDLDDVVSHEWTHAYTQYTHGLIYSYQSGALNESYSDIFGETVDLLNGEDGTGGDNNAEPYPNGQRWLVGEDIDGGTGGVQELLLRDMCDPDRLGSPGSMKSDSFTCSADDQGGVHYNSGVPNHAYALLVDGSDMCDPDSLLSETVNGIGFTKAAAIYFRAMDVYQTRTTQFADHADALEMSCDDLIGVNLAPPTLAGGVTPPDGTISAADCEQVRNAMVATGMQAEDAPCDFVPILLPGAPEACDGAATVLAEDWSDGLDGWTTTTEGVNPEWPGYNWTVVDEKPDGVAGSAAFAIDSVAGTCAAGGDYSGRFALTSATITVPDQSGRLQLRFDHYVETEPGYDGGNLMISINGGDFEVVPQEAFVFNGPRTALASAVGQAPNTNPKAGEMAWHGTDEGTVHGSWGTTVVDLGSIVTPDDEFQLRFDFGIDGCNGVTGWYVGTVSVVDCPNIPGPVLSLGEDYEDPDTDGSYTLEWQRPAEALAPDQLQQSRDSCAPIMAEDAETAITSRWTMSQEGDEALTDWGRASDKPSHAGNSVRVLGVEETRDSSSIATWNQPIALPATGRVLLRFSEWFVNELDDRGFVEVSADDGATWTAVYTTDRALEAGDADAAFAAEDLAAREVDLTAYQGQTVRLRLRYYLGKDNYTFYKPVGWWVDDIAVVSDRWTTLVDDDVTSATLSDRADGRYCYRARSSFTFGGQTVWTNWSNVVDVTVDRPDDPADADGDGIVDSADNCPEDWNPGQFDDDDDGTGNACDADAPCPDAGPGDDGCTPDAGPGGDAGGLGDDGGIGADDDGDGGGCGCRTGGDATGPAWLLVVLAFAFRRRRRRISG